MKSYFHSFYKILISIFNYFFHEETYIHKRTTSERLISALLCDRMDFYLKQSNNYDKSCKDLTEQPISQQNEPIQYQAPSIPDIKKQFRIWSANMREYDSIRKRLLDSSAQ